MVKITQAQKALTDVSGLMFGFIFMVYHILKTYKSIKDSLW